MATKKDTSKMPKTKKNLGATDAGQAQRIGGLKAAGNYFSGADKQYGGKALAKAYGNARQKNLKADVMKKKSSGGGSTKKK